MENSINGLEVDTFKTSVFIEDRDSGYTVQLTAEQSIALANRLIRAAGKAQSHER